MPNKIIPEDMFRKMSEAFQSEDVTRIKNVVAELKSKGLFEAEAKGGSPLMVAVGYNSLPAVRVLVEEGANLNYQAHGCTALTMAIYKDEKLVEYLVNEAKMRPSESDKNHMTDRIIQGKVKNIEKMRQLIFGGPSTELPDIWQGLQEALELRSQLREPWESGI